ncbi:PIN domain-containing protein [Jiangella rhizosphaerae]|uniref:PIN domain-containing protein n=1 Tax=Jiangella rhizosphaerae TaxID=2293569 RepID=A0A418KLV6_9ACTN|nr:PIN domain-containing protein [Jiangella rhizosphaerae]RIQ18931.1 PIN domain-containing protein [Jiangella rhizosphaerae]
MTDDLDLPGMVRVVLVDANVLYSRVLRDYLLYAADEEIIAIAWSRQILDEVTEHLAANVAGFTIESGMRLASAMNRAFPYAEVEPTPEDHERLSELALPDEDDRHVIAAAVAAEATVLCTANTKDFPDDVAGPLGFEVMTPDALLSILIAEYPVQMLAAHATAAAQLRGATDPSTIAALERAGAPIAAARMVPLLESAGIALD